MFTKSNSARNYCRDTRYQGIQVLRLGASGNGGPCPGEAQPKKNTMAVGCSITKHLGRIGLGVSIVPA
jgi:hypothetical protein